MKRDETFPLEAVRDLLGIVRAFYGARRAGHAGRHELSRIARVGKELADAIDLAATARPGSVAYRAACAHAEHAALEAGNLIDIMTPAAPLMRVARSRVSGVGAPTLRKRREER